MAHLLTSGDGNGSRPHAANYTQLPVESNLGGSWIEYLRLIRRHYLFVLVAVSFAVGIAAYQIYREVPRYRAKAVVRISDSRRALTGGVATDAAQALGAEASAVLTQIQILRSRGVAREAVDSLGLRLRPEDPAFPSSVFEDVRVGASPEIDRFSAQFTTQGVTISRAGGAEHQGRYGLPIRLGQLEFTVSRYPGVAAATFNVIGMEDAVDAFLADFTARPREKTDVIDLEYVSADPVLSQRVVNTVAEIYQAYSARSAQQESRRRRIFLQEQLQETDSLVAVAQLALSDFRRTQKVFSSRDKFVTQQNGLTDLEIRREELDAEIRMYENLLRALESGQSDRGQQLGVLVSAPGLSSNPLVTQLYTQLVSLQTSRDSLTTGSWGAAASNPDVQRLDALIASTESRLVNAVRSAVSSLRARSNAIDGMLSRDTAQIARLPEVEAEEVRLMEQLATVQKTADNLRSEYQRARIAEAVEAGQVEIVDFAAVPRQPIDSGHLRKMLLAAMLGLLGGIAVAIGIEQVNTSIRRREEVETILRVPGLAVIPRIAPGQQGRSRSRISAAHRTRLASGSNGTSRPVESPLITIAQLQSSGAEAYRTLRTNLIFSQSVQELKKIVVTSASAGEGKTTTAANLAVTFAQQGLRVILIDCDLRRARVHRLFNVPRSPGLADVLIGRNLPSDAIRLTDARGLAVIPAGVSPPNPAELLGSMQMRSLLDEVAEMYDIILLDSPPLLAASDASILAAATDGALLVVRAGHTDRGLAQHALRQLQSVGARVIGAVLNDPDAKLPSYEGYKYYYDYYGAEEEERAGV